MTALRLGRHAYTVDALVEAGVPPALARTLLADGPRAVPERPRLAVGGRQRAPATTAYVWGPDAEWLLEGVPGREKRASPRVAVPTE